MNVDQNEDRVYRLTPRYNPQAQGHFMCDEGRFTYHELDSRRVAAPRISGETTSMDKAISFAAERLAPAGATPADRVAAFLGRNI